MGLLTGEQKYSMLFQWRGPGNGAPPSVVDHAGVIAE